jgi:hypothetical protein
MVWERTDLDAEGIAGRYSPLKRNPCCRRPSVRALGVIITHHQDHLAWQARTHTDTGPLGHIDASTRFEAGRGAPALSVSSSSTRGGGARGQLEVNLFRT